jgi:ferritin-like metal-binding protein YciE
VATKISNPRDLLLAELGELLYVERRLAGEVLPSLVRAVADERLRTALAEHLEQTRGHIERAETAFRRVDAAPSANLSRAFEGVVSQHDELVRAIVLPGLADAFDASSALLVEHLEIAGYRAAVATARALGHDEVADLLDETLREEQGAARTLDELLVGLVG